MGSKNFKYLDELIHSGAKEIVLDSDIVLGDDEESEYSNGIRLDVDDISIDGNGFTIDARGKTRIFYCTRENIAIKNITLKNGFSKEHSGAIYNHGRLSITDSTFIENTTQGIYGGGGAIGNGSGRLCITDSTFIENTTNEDGGAIFNRGRLSITDSTFIENTAQDKGGAICTTNRQLSITGSTFNNNTAQEYGGAISNGSRLCITDSTFIENTAEFRGGGAIYNDGKLTIIKSTLTGNTTNKGGGAIDNWGKLTITDSIFLENTAQGRYGYGGAICNNGGELSTTSSTFNNNTAQECGGAIFNYSNGNLTITESSLIGNTAESDGGAIKNVDGGSLNIVSCKILSNKSQNNIIFNESFMEVHNTKFNNNQSEHVLVNEYPEFNISIIDSQFIGNNVEKDVICNNGKSCTIKNTIFEDNLSRNITNKTDLTLISSKIKDDGQSILNYGHILIRQSPNLESKIYGDGTVETDTILQEEETFDFGYLDKKIHESKTKEIILDYDVTFENYEIDYYEGGIELDMNDLVIDGNGHTIDGAKKSRIFIVTGKNITLKNITFKNGVTHDNYHYHFNVSGGAIRINSNAKITIENCKFINNTAQEYGGAISNWGEITITESTLQENTAQEYGGAIYNREGKITITESTLQENTAQEYGGAISNNGGNLTVTESMLTGNTAQMSGGAICNNPYRYDLNRPRRFNRPLSEGVLTITESAINNNTADRDGGAIHNDDKLTIIGSTLSGNAAQNNGGAIHNDDKLTIIGSTLSGNAAQNNGGAIYLRKSKYESENCTFKDNEPYDVYEEE